jgi:Tol biopolymer transport system component
LSRKLETTPIKNARVGQADLSKWLLLAAGLAALTLTMPPLASAAGKPADKRADYWIGYTSGRTDLQGYYPNQDTNRAFVVRGDGSGATELAPELVSKPHQRTAFAGWSPDGHQAILYQSWESPENGAWEDKHGTWRFSAEHWLLDIILLDMKTKKTTNLTAVERVSFYNAGLHFWPKQKLGFSAMIGGELRPYQMDRDGKNKKPVSAVAGFIYGVLRSPDGKRICYHRNYRLYLADGDGRNARPVKDNNPFHFIPLWSPTGEWVAYLSGEHYNCHPHLVRPDGTGLRKLADRGGYRGVIQPIDKGGDGHSERSDIHTWSPDGKWLYYTAKVGAAVELMRASPAGSIEQLTRSKAGVSNYLPQVSPDSKWVLFGSTRAGPRQLYVARADGTGVYPITRLKSGWGAIYGYWRPKP